MFRRASLCAVTAFFALIVTGNLGAQDEGAQDEGAQDDGAQYELVKVVTERQEVMFDMLGAYWPLLAVKNGESTDLAAAAAASQSIEDATGRFSALMVPGTAKGEVPGSRANPEVWTEPADFAAALNALQAATAALSDAASSGDIASFNARFDTFASACVGCHEFKPSSGGRFRAAF